VQDDLEWFFITMFQTKLILENLKGKVCIVESSTCYYKESYFILCQELRINIVTLVAKGGLGAPSYNVKAWFERLIWTPRYVQMGF